ncbi:GNAT family N-acetyltransferase [Sphingobacterium hungaricum]
MNIVIASDLHLALTDKSQLEELFMTIQENRDHLIQYLSWVEGMTSLEPLAAYIDQCDYNYRAGTDISFVIVYQERIVGRIGLHYINRHNRNGAIGYWLDKSVEGKGIISACCKKLIDYAFEKVGLERLELKAAVQNQRSRSVAERMGFQQEGIMRHAEIVNGTFYDLVLYAMLKGDWEQARRDEIHAI